MTIKTNKIKTKQTISELEANWISVQLQLFNSSETILLNIAKEDLFIPESLSKEIILDLLIKSVESINIKDDLGTYLIHWTIFNNNIKLSTLLIENNIDINVRNPKGLTPLHLAVQYNHTELIYLLLNHNAIVNCPDFHGNTPIFLAEYNKNHEIVNLLNNINKVENKIEISDKKIKNESSKFYQKNKTIISNILDKRKSIQNNIN